MGLGGDVDGGKEGDERNNTAHVPENIYHHGQGTASQIHLRSRFRHIASAPTAVSGCACPRRLKRPLLRVQPIVSTLDRAGLLAEKNKQGQVKRKKEGREGHRTSPVRRHGGLVAARLGDADREGKLLDALRRSADIRARASTRTRAYTPQVASRPLLRLVAEQKIVDASTKPMPLSGLRPRTTPDPQIPVFGGSAIGPPPGAAQRAWISRIRLESRVDT